VALLQRQGAAMNGKTKSVRRRRVPSAALWAAIAKAKRVLTRADASGCLAIVRESNAYHVVPRSTPYPIDACVCPNGHVTIGECEHARETQ
jgi:hypothetical protein